MFMLRAARYRLYINICFAPHPFTKSLDTPLETTATSKGYKLHKSLLYYFIYLYTNIIMFKYKIVQLIILHTKRMI